MDNLHCNRCGEEYSSTYRRCPFCQEIAAERRGRPIYRSGKRLSKKQRMAGAGGVIKVVAAVTVLCVALIFYFGSDVAQFLGIRTQQPDGSTPSQNVQQDPTQKDPQIGTDDPTVPDNGGQTGSEDQTGEGSDAGTDENQGDGDVVYDPLTISQSAITIPAGETARITAEGGRGEIVWTSSNEEIAVVNGGSVTGIAGGTVTITATSGEETVTCTVTITGTPWVNPADLSLNRTDFTLRAGDPPFQLKVKGTESTVVWSSSNVNVATVDSNGVVHRVGTGNCTITAEVDGQILKCIVRVA